MKAFVIAGGEGTRLRPYTYSTPKPMLKLGGRPILYYVLQNLKRAGVKEVIITVGYLYQQIIDYFKDGKELGLKIEYSIEKERKNTAGSIINHKVKVNEPILVMMGDHITNIDLKAMMRQHQETKAFATIALYRSKTQIDFGVAQIDENGSISGFKEKPLLEHSFNTAIYIFDPEIFQYIQTGEDFGKDVIPRIIKEGKRVLPFYFEEVWLDIGKTNDYERLFEFFNVVRFFKELG
ncbi:nucleotidyltransferase family protein [Candidatus Micrarchaeota archaeon]|nr:nucleotidyltransferase family protein [Candidatus Micrarchaeota archaeon]